MARRRSRGGSNIGFIVVLAALVMLVLAIVGVCLDWLAVDSSYFDLSYTLGEMKEEMDALGELTGEIGTKFNAMFSFAVLTVILTAATTVLAGICKVLHWKLFRFVLVVVAIVCVICGVMAIVMTYSYIDVYGTLLVPAVGMWLTSIGGILGGLIGVAAAVKN